MPPSIWFNWHEYLFAPGKRVLDIACGAGRHSLAAAALGAEVTGIDWDSGQLEIARENGDQQGLNVEWRQLDLESDWPDLGQYDVVLLFNYLDRERMTMFRNTVAPGGSLIVETFLVAQRELGWGPESDEHLLRPGELAQLVAPLEIVHGREVLEPVDSERWRAVASVVAQKIG